MRRMSLVVIIVVLGAGVTAQDHQHAVDRLGTVHFETSCTAAAQPRVDRALALLHSFAFSGAVAAFNEALAADPACAIAYWGLALSAWGNPFAAGLKPEAQLQRGLDAINSGRATGAKTDRERGYIAAASRLFDDFRAIDQRTRLLAYTDAMAALAARYPDDNEASIFYALALAISADPNDKTYTNLLAAGAILEKLTAGQPDHPGLAHYIIHSYDVPSLASRALGAAHRYAAIAPGAPHALHMPSHTFTRVGDWRESIKTNMASAAAARSEASTAEELHATDYMMYAYLQTGEDRAAQRLLSALPEIGRRFNPNALGGGAPPAAGYFALAAVPARYALERGAWREAMRLEVRRSPLPFADAMTHFARALGASRIGDTAIPKSAIAELQRIREQLASAKEAYWTQQVEIQQRGASAWLAFAEGRKDEAVAEMRATADLEDATEKNAITPGPIAPARELLGEMLLEVKRPVEALREFERTLMKEPNRFRALAGAAKAAAAAGEREAARKYYSQLLAVAARADRPGRAELVDARRSVAR